jgi:hypothetical protein
VTERFAGAVDLAWHDTTKIEVLLESSAGWADSQCCGAQIREAGEQMAESISQAEGKALGWMGA